MAFERKISKQLIHSLNSNNLYSKHLKSDLTKHSESKSVFLTIRNNSLDFYHRGQNLFKFTKEFTTNVKFASVIDFNKDYISENELAKGGCFITNFELGYDRIKENCSKYRGPEDSHISVLYSKFSYLNKNADLVVLDIEISFKSLNKTKTQDRIDILLYDKKTRLLQFVEAKHHSNGELSAQPNACPEVIGQIKRYEKQIKVRRKDIITQYTKYIAGLNAIFDKLNLPDPVDVEEKVILLVMGCGDKTLKNKIMTNPYYKGIKYCQIKKPGGSKTFKLNARNAKII